MASGSGSCSSSAVPTGRWKYDVFLSFRGEDIRYTFLDHLYADLVQKGIFVFKDDEELKTGEPISTELLKAIEESRYAVVVFSKNYANSSWCLAELARIMECHKELGQKVIPVFYHVDPSDIRGQKNEVADFFQQHEERFREELDKVKEWRDALTAAANLSGHHISETINEGESSYIRKIVEGILADRRLSYMESNLVGIDSHMDALNSLLRIEENDKVLIVGIHGMGGIGKTTIAKALFRRIADKFEGSSFVYHVRENSSSKRDLCALQEQVLKEILMTNHDFNVRDPKDGANLIRARFAHKKVLLVFDDVDDCKQLEFLSATHKSFGPGSRIIITTRNQRLLFGANAEYEPDCLLTHEALELFSRHAFKRDSPPKGYEELSRHAIRYAGCLPLAVKVLGSFFRGREADVWESALSRLAKAPNVEIFETLKLSYDGLEDSDKKIFLDIACFFKGKYVKDVTKVLEGCGFDSQIGIEILIERSLITISYDEEIDMHDLIQEMGWQIVRESFPNSRLWRLEDIHDSLKDKQNLEKIEAIKVSDEQHDKGFSANVFKHMKNLRLLDVRGKFTSSKPTFFPDNLRWLSWRWYPFSSLSMTHMNKLVGLEVNGGAIKKFWNGQKVMLNLKIVKLERLHYLKKFPDVSWAPNIEELLVRNCMKLVKFHKSLGSHKRISKLKVIGCERLNSLPSSFEMESLKALKVKRCSSLERFPNMSPCMVNLEKIHLDCCSSIEGLVSSLGYLYGLRKLKLESERRPMQIRTQMCKEYLEKHGRKLNFKKLYYLVHLNLRGRPLESIVFLNNLQSFSYLEELELSGNNNLIKLPATISYLSDLMWLKLNECHQLQSLQGLPSSICILEANNCYSLKKIDDLSGGYDLLREISFMNCHKLLKDKDSKRYLAKMLQKSFFKRCAATRYGETSIGIAGNKIPRWFKEEEAGCEIRLMIPPNCSKQIRGIVICAVFPPVEELKGRDVSPRVTFGFEKAGVSFPHNQSLIPDSSVSDSVLAGEKGYKLLYYKPASGICKFQAEDWSKGGTALVKIYPYMGARAVRCAAHVIYEEDMVEFTQQKK